MPESLLQLLSREVVPDMTDSLGRQPSVVERALFIAVMLLSIGLQHLQGGGDSESGSSFAELIWAFAYVIAIRGLFVQRQTVVPLIRRSGPLLLIVALALLSTTWSYDPLLTLRRAFGLFGTTAIAYYLVSRYDMGAFVNALIKTIIIAALISVPLIMFVPMLGVMQERSQGAWQGLFLEKNGLGGVMALGIATMLLLFNDSRGLERTKLLAWISLCSVLLIGSRSATPIVGLLIVIICLSAMFRFRQRRIGAISLLAVSVIAVICLFGRAAGLGLDDALNLLGRDATLSGRTEVWSYAMQYISERPWLGYGYHVFWEPSGPVQAYLLKDLGWEPMSTHNGFLEVALNFGFVGLFAFLYFLFHAIRRAWRFFASGTDRLSAWPFLAIVSLTIANFTDPTFAQYNDFRWLVFMVAFIYATANERDLDASLSSTPARLSFEG